MSFELRKNRQEQTNQFIRYTDFSMYIITEEDKLGTEGTF
jgi:hypothetical protein